MRRLALLTMLALVLAGFTPSPSLSWGHLPPSWQLQPGERLFLINWPKGKTYRVCVPRSESSPGLAEEIEAAVNVWARELGRTIPVQVVTRDVPQARAASRTGELREALVAGCGDADLAFAYAALPGETLGETGFKQTRVTTETTSPGGRRVTTSEQRASGRTLFLRDLTAAPMPATLGGPRLAWAAFTDVVPGAAGAHGSALRDAILARYAARDTVTFAFDGQLPRIAVLVHELGHVWGLCDLYESQQLCDPRHSAHVRLPPGRFAVMGPVVYRQQLFLADDDIAGLRALADRPGFDAWHGVRPEPRAVRLPEVEMFRAQITKRTENHVIVDGHVMTNRPSRFAVELRLPGESAWRTVGTIPEGGGEPGAIVEPQLRYDLEMQEGAAGAQVRLKLEVKRENGSWGAPSYLVPR